jgi:phosphate transport system substrate-binding protein
MGNVRGATLGFLALWLTVAAVTWCPAQGERTLVVRVKGAGTLAGTIDRISKSFMADNQGISVVVSAGGTGAGFAALLDGTTEVVMASRPVASGEKAAAEAKGLKLVDRLVGWDGVAVVVQPENPVPALTLQQLQDIFAGKCSQWSMVGGPNIPLSPFIAEYPRSGTSEFFRDYVLKGKPFATTCLQRRYYPNLLKEAARNNGAISFVPLRYVKKHEQTDPVKIVGIKKNKESAAVVASEETVADRSYPLIRPLFLYYREDPKARHVKQFVEYCAMKGLGLR